ncbi:MAG: auracyanin family protein, partial [Planctomycetia bacterium]
MVKSVAMISATRAACCLAIVWAGMAGIHGMAAAAEPPAKPATQPKEKDFYSVDPVEIPPEALLEVGALEWLPDGRLAVATRRGEIWIATDPASDKPRWKRFAHGLHEVLGLAWRDGWLYVTQRPEVSRLRDTTGDGVADDHETFCAD